MNTTLKNEWEEEEEGNDSNNNNNNNLILINIYFQGVENILHCLVFFGSYTSIKMKEKQIKNNAFIKQTFFSFT